MTTTLHPPPCRNQIPRQPNLKDQDHLFDLCGYRIFKNAVSSEQLRHINAFADQHDSPGRKPGDWIGPIEVPTAPGLGIEINEAVLQEKSYNGAWQNPRLYHEDGSVAEW